ncbi:AfsR/SARP family transcriptional regulator [Streptomyces sp. S3(2020)]|uniref:AfsR/SARP family transcriptional regulator n=1 Tax=Streptomyces sp. S3(2020) TaxID=2732044 RepID=UPI0014885218|nr:BTAD domain-containing putative transcriptional regulator [Streptomyces sp. S3(2020)]NNN31861.1 AfsR/SARP family transcriptional regulator [Streptomyces sp. S3(2020)]
MRFKVLGPLEVTTAAGARTVTPRAAKVRVVLSTLLVRPNEVVSVDGLIDELWSEHPPRTAMTTLQVYISQLRKLLQDVQPELGRDALLTRAPGYLLRVDPGQLDLAVFEDLHRQGREALGQGDHADAADLQRQALALWRGPLLSDTPHGSLLKSMSVRLTEARLAALEQRVRAELQLGRHQEVLGELQALTTELPLHEDFHAHLMVALYRTGRQADALRTFSDLRRTLVQELAIEPGRRLQQLHGRILTGDPSLLEPAAKRQQRLTADRPPSAAITDPAPTTSLRLTQFPSPDPLFTGRTTQLEQLTRWLRDLPGGCVQVTGPAGMGKTALAVSAAHRVTELFPDGQVLVGLRDEAGHPLPEVQVLHAVLRALGAGGRPPHSVTALRDTVHRLTEGRRLLLLLDDAVDAGQLRLLLPLPAGCTALATSRPVLSGLDGPVLPLEELPSADARDLLLTSHDHRTAPYSTPAYVKDTDDTEGTDEGHDYDTDEPEIAPGARGARDVWDRLADQCGRSPGALRAVAQHLMFHPHHSPTDIATRLSAESRPAALRTLDEEYGRSLYAAYTTAPEKVRQAARLLSLLPSGPFTTAAAAVALGVSPEAATLSLRSLVTAGLLISAPDGTRHRFPELQRLTAAEALGEEQPARVRAALTRLSTAAADQAGSAQQAARVDGLHPLDWFTRRRHDLVALLDQVHDAGLWAQTVRLADAMTVFLEALAAWDVWEHTHTLALDAAGHLTDEAARARLLRSLGDLAWQRQRSVAARELYERVLASPEAVSTERSRALAGLADVHLVDGAGTLAAGLVTPTLLRAPDDTRGCFEAHRVLGLHTLVAGGASTAEDHFRECLTLAGTLGDRRLEAFARRWLGRLRDGSAHPGWTEVRPGIWRGRHESAVRAGSGARVSSPRGSEEGSPFREMPSLR